MPCHHVKQREKKWESCVCAREKELKRQQKNSEEVEKEGWWKYSFLVLRWRYFTWAGSSPFGFTFYMVVSWWWCRRWNKYQLRRCRPLFFFLPSPIIPFSTLLLLLWSSSLSSSFLVASVLVVNFISHPPLIFLPSSRRKKTLIMGIWRYALFSAQVEKSNSATLYP